MLPLVSFIIKNNEKFIFLSLRPEYTTQLLSLLVTVATYKVNMVGPYVQLFVTKSS